MNFTQSTPNRLFISLDPVGERAFLFCFLGAALLATMFDLPELTLKDDLAFLIMIGGLSALFLWQACRVELDFQRATDTLIITKSFFRWAKVKTLPLATIKGVTVKNEDGGAIPTLLLQHPDGRQSRYSLTGAASSTREANDLAQIITQWLEAPNPA